MTPTLFLVAVLGCGTGATLRYAISRLDRHGRFPWPTIVSNIAGSALLGCVAATVVDGGVGAGWLLVLGGGVAGGLSTFSTLAVDAVILWREGRTRALAAYVGATLATGLGAAALGWTVGLALV
ncbi:fluoride efflux transporter FluC [Demequina aestuarii]|uniref:fluoride efflux transporter FluC n=1 Tax=Demequina aestuarii TaxID=327095 RepID=UPI000780D7F1|nr:CrcB family protein [Demequina aestuarii]